MVVSEDHGYAEAGIVDTHNSHNDNAIASAIACLWLPDRRLTHTALLTATYLIQHTKDVTIQPERNST